MRQLVQSLRDGSLEVVEVPSPKAKRGMVHVRNLASVISPGTERAMQELAKKSLLEKALARPDLVRKVLEKARKDGTLAAYRAASARLD
ncbi:MAG: theronine dehydrogenase, partial [Deltaproteobacteria bacterium]|nr:theronine dehydrogenase [Deltaproteobacteria bacterium]